ncbi:acetyltransferase [Pedobacter sp. HMWF019]|nr:acetyltransferase [Pedobacter sp. HMWF019]
MSVSNIIKSNLWLRKLAHWLLIPVNDYRPRLWVRLLLNPFKHKRGRGSIVRYQTRLDLFPYNKFQLGKNSVIESYSTVNNGVGDVFIGDHTIVGLSNTIIGPVEIGNGVMLAQGIVISGLNHGYMDINQSPSTQKVVTKKITVGDDVWVGANVVITAGVSIGKHSVIGGGSVVTKDVPEYAVVVGNPAKLVKKYNFESCIWEKVKS